MKTNNVARNQEKTTYQQWCRRALVVVLTICLFFLLDMDEQVSDFCADVALVSACVLVVLVLAKLTPTTEVYCCKNCGHVHIPKTGFLFRSQVMIDCPVCMQHTLHEKVGESNQSSH